MKKIIYKKEKRKAGLLGRGLNPAIFVLFSAFIFLIFQSSLINSDNAGMPVGVTGGMPGDSLGCCFDSVNMGTCSRNSWQSECTNLGGTFFSSPTCAIPECAKGCCVLGTVSMQATQAECAARSLSIGQSINYQENVDIIQCQAQTQAQETGACLIGSYPPYSCTITTGSQCASGNFKPGVSCTNPALRTNCVPTSYTMCWPPGPGASTAVGTSLASASSATASSSASVSGTSTTASSSTANSAAQPTPPASGVTSVYTADSCGNPDQKLQECDFAAGTICRQTDAGAATCKDTKCTDASGNERLHSEQWCTFGFGANGQTCTGNAVAKFAVTKNRAQNSNVLSIDTVKYEYLTDKGDRLIFRVIRQQNIMGGMQEYGCSKEEGVIIKNDVKTNRICINTNSWKSEASAEVKGMCSPQGHAEKITAQLSECSKKDSGKSYEAYSDGYDEYYDSIVKKALSNSKPGLDKLKGKIISLTTSVEPNYLSAVGSEYYEQYCDMGEVKTASSSNKRDKYCDNGKLVQNYGTLCTTTAGSDMSKCDVSIENGGTGACVIVRNAPSTNTVGCKDPRSIIGRLKADTPAPDTAMFEGNIMPICAPKYAAPGSEIRSLSTSASSSSPTSPPTSSVTGAENSICSAANFNGTANFYHRGGQNEDDINPADAVGGSHVARSIWSLFGDYEVAIYFDSNPSHWFSGERYSGTGYSSKDLLCNIGNPLMNFNPCINGSDPGEGEWGCRQAACQDLWDGYNRKGISWMQIDPGIVNYLENRCAAIGDCGYKANWISVSGKKVNGISGIKTKNFITEKFDLPSTGLTADAISGNDMCLAHGGVCVTIEVTGGRTSNYDCTALPTCTDGITCRAVCNKSMDNYYIPCELDGHDQPGMPEGSRKTTCKIDFKCGKWNAPENGTCSKCGNSESKIPCSSYKCQSLGTNCELSAETGFCYDKNDRVCAEITMFNMSQPDPVPPFTPVTFTVETNEISQCRFGMGFAAVKYEDMPYAFGGEEWSTTHTMQLTYPGALPPLFTNTLSMPLLNGEGKYEMFVRCRDTAGNDNCPATALTFNIMQNPDLMVPIILNITPPSGSGVKFNTTTKDVTLKLDQPAECRWSNIDQDYNTMENNFSCDILPTTDGMINLQGYRCSGALTGITTTIGEKTNFYIRCKDQPWLQGQEDNIYKRNTNTVSYVYTLFPSEELKIIDFSPTGSKKVGGANFTATLTVETSGGVFSGKALCSWRMSNATDSGPRLWPFQKTNSNTHSQEVYPYIGLNNVQIICTDSAENQAAKFYQFTLEVDKSAPILSRILHPSGSLKIKTDEESVCYVSFNQTAKCLYKLNNYTSIMEGVEKEHTTEWKDDKIYYIKCRDYFGNANSATCAGIIRTY